jgi:ketosteroid isomerase-like protein
MAQENVEVVRTAFETFNRGDMPAFAGLLHHDIELKERFELSTSPGPHRGLDGGLAWYRDSGRHWSSYETELIDAVSAGTDVVVAEGEVRARGRTSAVETRRRFGYLFGISEGRIIRFEIFGTKDDALEAAGLGR